MMSTSTMRLPFLAAIGLLAGLTAWAAVPDTITTNGGRYFGPLRNGRLDGFGRIEWSNGTVYVGQFSQGLSHGEGQVTLFNGDRYAGRWANGMFEGLGRYTSRRIDYSGQFKHDEFSGYGRAIFDDGRRYEGQWEHGEMHGYGRMTAPDGQRYEGRFEHDDLKLGRYTRSEGNHYEGTFSNWRPDGYGRLVADKVTYIGRFKAGEMEGVGVIEGGKRRYRGEIENWQPSGRGEMVQANGDVYRGRFAYGMYDGDGVLTYAKPKADGTREQRGPWQHGRLKDAPDPQADAFETALYRQTALLDKALAGVRPSDSKRIELYLLAVGAGSQKVFSREAVFVREQFAKRFGTSEHAIVLANAPSIAPQAPLATYESLSASVRTIARRMDRDNDILFLFLTSHGSRDHQLTFDMPGVKFKDLGVDRLAALLKDSGIKHRVVVISACFSGGFVKPLSDAGTLVITASRADRTSFGCSDDADMTYFGRAFFEESLPNSASFQDAFERAKAAVRKREDDDAQADAENGKRSDAEHSEPQMAAGSRIAAQLERWRRELSAR